MIIYSETRPIVGAPDRWPIYPANAFGCLVYHNRREPH